MSVEVFITRLPGSEDLPLPCYQTLGSVGLDLCAAVVDDVTIWPGRRVKIPIGIAIAIPIGYEGQIRPRSGLAWEHGVTVVNSPGTIDSDYRGQLAVLLVNLGSRSLKISRGDRIAQLVVSPVTQVAIRETKILGNTPRGDGGFGSTGV